jgi:hypothetical protein
VTGTRHHQTRSDLTPDPGPVQRGHAEPESWQRAHSTLWPWMSIAAACIAGFANIVGLADIDRIYGTETSAFIDQAIAQDTVSLAIVCPAIVVLALLARRGSLAAHLAWLGTLAFTVYNYVIYTLSIHVGPLFLPWIAVLSLSLFALIGGSADRRSSTRTPSPPDFSTRAPRSPAGSSSSSRRSSPHCGCATSFRRSPPERYQRELVNSVCHRTRYTCWICRSTYRPQRSPVSS